MTNIVNIYLYGEYSIFHLNTMYIRFRVNKRFS